MSNNGNGSATIDLERLETRDWLDSLEDVLHMNGRPRVKMLMRDLQIHAQRQGVALPVTSRTPYVNTIPPEKQPAFPGNRDVERRIKSLLRWNAMAMVVGGNKTSPGIGGHISTFASSATLYDVGLNHFFRGPDHECGGDLVFYQGHAAPGMYSRAFMEGRLSEQDLLNFRRELADGGGLSSYPHPWLMPNFWQFPTVSMGLGPLMAIYQARFMRYLDDRGIRPYKGAKVWAYLGDGECDEPETLGAISLASREKLDNLIFVINCNLQRLDGPVRGNGNIIQELEAVFRGAGWNVIKCIWGSEWDDLFARDHDGVLAKAFDEVVDGELQKYTVEDGAYLRKHFFGRDPRLLKLVEHLSDEQLWHMKLGGHDPVKVYAAYKAATETVDQPTVILARTIKGYGLGEAGEGKNITHQQKKLNEEELLHFRNRFNVPISEEEAKKTPFYRPAEGSEEHNYLMERRRVLGGSVPQRKVLSGPLNVSSPSVFEEFHQGTAGREVSTTMAFVRILVKLLRDKEIGKNIVPIVPDEARTFGMDAMFKQFGIYSHVGQLYEPVDRKQLAYYKEATDGQILEEGINEAGSMCSLIAAGTSHVSHGPNMIPFYIYYSMFGFQRVGDLIWAAGDMRCRGFMLGGTAGRTTLNGEGLQHQDGHSHLIAQTVPNLLSYDPAYAYELAVIIEDGIKRMYHDQEDIFYYISVCNDDYAHPAMPSGAREGILKGMYKVKSAEGGEKKTKVDLLGSGPILRAAIEGQKILQEKFNIAADVWSVTSYKALRNDAVDVERHNMLHPDEKPNNPYIHDCLKGSDVVVATSDYMKALPDLMAKWIPGKLVSLGTDGFGRSEARDVLRDHFEIDGRYVALGALFGMVQQGKLDGRVARKAVTDLGIDPDKPNPLYA